MAKKQNTKLKEILNEFKPQYATLFIFSAVVNILMLVPSWYMLQVYDRVLTSYDENTLFGLTIIVVFLYLIYGLLEKYRGLILVGVSEIFDQKTVPLIHSAILTPSLKEKQKNIAGLQDLNNVKQFLTGQPMLAFLDAPWVFIFLIVIYLLHPQLGALALLSALILLIIAILNQRATSTKLAQAQQDSTIEKRFVSNALLGSESIQVMGMRGLLKKQMEIFRNKYLINHIEASAVGAKWSAIVKFFRVVIQSAILGYGGHLAINNEITPGMMIAASILMGRALAPIEGVINSWKQLGEFKKSYLNLEDILSTGRPEEFSVELGKPKGEILIQDVSLNLRSNGKPTLDSVNLKINSGEVLAIIGPSGSGKTSLLKVMCGLYIPNKGQALIDGADLAHCNLDAIGKHLGYLSQTTELLAGKISENIARFNEVDSNEVLRVSKLTGAHEVVASMPEGYEFILGDGGDGLSEGQKRKIGLARAFYGSPAIIFLDEPGNGLEDASVLTLIKAIRSLKDLGVTVVYSTHQKALVELSDKILVLVDGQVKHFGQKNDVLDSIMVRG